MRIQKYRILEVKDEVEFNMPEGAEVLCVQCMYDYIFIWAAVEMDAKAEVRKFRLVRDGHEFDMEGVEYVGTAQMYGGQLVWHVFEVVE